MKKILFIAPIDSLNQNSGIRIKVNNEYLAFSKNFDAYLSTFEGNDVVIRHGDEIIFRDSGKKHRIFKQFNLADFILENRINYLYIRYSLAFPQQVWMLKKVRKHVEKIAFEFPDYPYIQEWTHKRRYLLAGMDCVFRKSLAENVDHAFGCTIDETINGIKNTRLINGTNISSYGLKTFDEHDYLGVLSVSTMSSQHGIDRFIEGLHQYYEHGGKKDIRFWIIGNGPEYNHIKTLVDEYHLKDHVELVGHVPNSEQSKYFDMCDIGLGALAFHRVNIRDDSTLKSREYGLRGMPIIAENKIDIVDENYKYVMYCPWDDSPVNIHSMIEFYDSRVAKYDPEVVGKEIRQYFIDRCDINITMKPVIEYFAGKD